MDDKKLSLRNRITQLDSIDIACSPDRNMRGITDRLLHVGQLLAAHIASIEHVQTLEVATEIAYECAIQKRRDDVQSAMTLVQIAMALLQKEPEYL